ncbi:uncharacterized protein A1O9_04093 [Exophiala aquamarina CBS 119918]|uniref:Phytanoyl-CoA dioxygenase n=1 Tax=Exophiala aquamarina CBS 119918 TaxID=1182545 RepID=A0A072PGL7_9EURO|nr:uncharacterized protein A1O9_04093 [Exophiala aquamarina CBS 119918]KEF59249.1 hypothetical protein A1O9_04093 [Exophiala aquamarina CBS 119918]
MTTLPSARDQDLEAYRSQLREEGWCVIPSVLDADQTKCALDALWAAKESSEARGDDTYLPFLDPNASNIRVFYLLELDAIFRSLIQHPTAVDMVKSVLGANFLISNFTANIARPGSKSMGLHSDQSLVSPEPWFAVTAVNVIWCLTDVYFENGATLFVPGSNKWQWRSDIPRARVKAMLQPFEAKAGSVVVMDGRVWHTSGANVTQDQDRALLFAYYTAPFLRQQVNWTRKLPREIQDALSPEMKEWLGLGVTANLGEAVSHLKYLDDEFTDDGDGEQQKGQPPPPPPTSQTQESLATSSHSRI